MTKKTKTWLELATIDLDFSKELLNKKGRYHYAAYFCHQAVEKLLKAIITRRTNKIPLPTHSFKLLLEQAGIKNIPEDKKRFIYSLSPHYIGTKYPEDITKLYQQYTCDFVNELYAKTEETFRWLKAYLR